jgi:hypothetical protein
MDITVSGEPIKGVAVESIQGCSVRFEYAARAATDDDIDTAAVAIGISDPGELVVAFMRGAEVGEDGAEAAKYTRFCRALALQCDLRVTAATNGTSEPITVNGGPITSVEAAKTLLLHWSGLAVSAGTDIMLARIEARAERKNLPSASA